MAFQVPPPMAALANEFEVVDLVRASRGESYAVMNLEPVTGSTAHAHAITSADCVADLAPLPAA